MSDVIPCGCHRWLQRILIGRHLKCVFFAAAISGSASALSGQTITMEPFVVSAPSVHEGTYVSTIVYSYFDSSGWNFNVSYYYTGETPNPEYPPGSREARTPGTNSIYIAWEAQPVKLGNYLSVTREYSNGEFYTLYIGGDAQYYHINWRSTGPGYGDFEFYWERETSDGWLESPPPPEIFPPGP